MTFASISEEYSNNGFVILRQVLPHEKIDWLLNNHLQVVNEIAKKSFFGSNDSELINFYEKNDEAEVEIYNKTQEMYALTDFSIQKEIIEPVKEILGNETGLFRKILFKMDLPLWTRELTHWHQDHFYVKGNMNILVASIPMQDTNYINGCISIMPRTHLLGLIKHDLKLGKKNIPANIFNNEIRMVEMKKGDLLLFSTLLLHSSNMNYSNSIRYSIQPRFTRLNEPVDEYMKGVIPI